MSDGWYVLTTLSPNGLFFCLNDAAIDNFCQGVLARVFSVNYCVCVHNHCMFRVRIIDSLAWLLSNCWFHPRYYFFFARWCWSGCTLVMCKLKFVEPKHENDHKISSCFLFSYQSTLSCCCFCRNANRWCWSGRQLASAFQSIELAQLHAILFEYISFSRNYIFVECHSW